MIRIQSSQRYPAPKDVGGVLLIVDYRLKILLRQYSGNLIQEASFDRLSCTGSELEINVSRAPLFSVVHFLQPFNSADGALKSRSVDAVPVESFPEISFRLKEVAHWCI